MWVLGEAASAAHALHSLHLGDVEEGLDAAAQIHDGEHADADLAAEHNERVVRHEGHESHRRQVVGHDDGQDDQHHLEGLLLHRVHLLLSHHGTPEDPDDGDVAEDHYRKGKEDDTAEDLVDAHNSQDALGEAVSQDEAPDHHGNANPDLIVSNTSEEHWVDHCHVAVQADTHLEHQIREGTSHYSILRCTLMALEVRTSVCVCRLLNQNYRTRTFQKLSSDLDSPDGDLPDLLIIDFHVYF